MMSTAEFFATNLEYSNSYDELIKLFVFLTARDLYMEKCIKRILNLHSKKIG